MPAFTNKFKERARQREKYQSKSHNWYSEADIRFYQRTSPLVDLLYALVNWICDDDDYSRAMGMPSSTSCFGIGHLAPSRPSVDVRPTDDQGHEGELSVTFLNGGEIWCFVTEDDNLLMRFRTIPAIDGFLRQVGKPRCTPIKGSLADPDDLIMRGCADLVNVLAALSLTESGRALLSEGTLLNYPLKDDTPLPNPRNKRRSRR